MQPLSKEKDGPCSGSIETPHLIGVICAKKKKKNTIKISVFSVVAAHMATLVKNRQKSMVSQKGHDLSLLIRKVSYVARAKKNERTNH